MGACLCLGVRACVGTRMYVWTDLVIKRVNFWVESLGVVVPQRECLGHPCVRVRVRVRVRLRVQTELACR